MTSYSSKIGAVIVVTVLVTALAASRQSSARVQVGDASSQASAAAFKEAATVFFSPRCVNCHPAGDTPLQGDKNVTHTFDVKRGPDGRGEADLKCNMCHQDTNTDGEGMPPGVPDWHMPGAAHKMSFQNISAGQLCRNLKDPLQNGGKASAKDAIEHVMTDPKVLWAWAPGSGRSVPPLSKTEFMQKMNEWVAGGAKCPE